MRNLALVMAGLVFCVAVAARPAAQETVARKTAREAVYTEAQAERGKKVYEANCVTCHLPELDGSANPDAGATRRAACGNAVSFRISASRRSARCSTR